MGRSLTREQTTKKCEYEQVGVSNHCCHNYSLSTDWSGFVLSPSLWKLISDHVNGRSQSFDFNQYIVRILFYSTDQWSFSPVLI